jgi:hypothetical protein
MYLLQGLIFCAVVGSNIHWQWTPKQYLASGIGAGLAWIATHIVVRWRDRRGPLVKKRPPGKQRRPQGLRWMPKMPKSIHAHHLLLGSRTVDPNQWSQNFSKRLRPAYFP